MRAAYEHGADRRNAIAPTVMIANFVHVAHSVIRLLKKHSLLTAYTFSMQHPAKTMVMMPHASAVQRANGWSARPERR